uniref:Uncharacterized protein n=1 Tax=Tetranychus urticae TaxID=32264 RepID=T1KRD3_TETUR
MIGHRRMPRGGERTYKVSCCIKLSAFKT